MELLASKDDKQIWIHELSRPYKLHALFSDEHYVCILFANDEGITEQEQASVSEQLVNTVCRYAVCAGHECSSWDTSIDMAYLATDENFSPPDETFVMTTSHEGESIEDVFFMA